MTDGPMSREQMMTELAVAGHGPMPACRCAVCAERSYRGEPALPGISVWTTMHITEEDLVDPRKAKAEAQEAARLEAARAAKVAAAAAAKVIPAGSLRDYPRDFTILLDAIAMYMVETFGEELAPIVKRIEDLEIQSRGVDQGGGRAIGRIEQLEETVAATRTNMVELKQEIRNLLQRQAELFEQLLRLQAQQEAQKERGRWRGVWRAGETYHEGDFVTDKGSLWHCNVDAAGSRPGTGKAWSLAVKRGRDAREGNSHDPD